jgi:TonB family protein
MLKTVISSVLAFLALAASSSAQAKHYGNLGDLVVTATGMATTPAPEADQRFVAVFVRVRYGGTDLACASLSAKLKGAPDIEYDEFARPPADTRWLDRPRVSQMSHGQESTGAYVFQVKNGVDPLALVLSVDSQTANCDAGKPANAEAAPAPQEIELDVHDLSAPAKEIDPATDLPKSGAGGYGSPLCMHCPAASYSSEAAKARIEGTVILIVVVTSDGRVTDIHVKQGLGFGLDAKAVEAVSKWRLKPARGPDGNPAAVRIPIEVSFRLH